MELGVLFEPCEKLGYRFPFCFAHIEGLLQVEIENNIEPMRLGIVVNSYVMFSNFERVIAHFHFCSQNYRTRNSIKLSIDKEGAE